jgi:ubiquinone/menaquinone biosynthesis C-methylase UbiE
MNQDKAMDRQQWAVDCMVIKPGDHILEIGCGAGHAVSWVCRKLKDGHVLAVDRSTTMIQKAMKHNKNHLESGRARFREGAFAELDWHGVHFDKVFAFNVNIFWMKPAPDFEILRNVLSPRGQAFFFYTPPDLTQLKKIMNRLPEMLEGHGFKIQKTYDAKLSATRAYGVQAR